MKQELLEINQKLDAILERLNHTASPHSEEQLLDIKEAAKYIRRSVPRLYKLVRSNASKSVRYKKGDKHLFTVHDLNEYLRKSWG